MNEKITFIVFMKTGEFIACLRIEKRRGGPCTGYWENTDV